MSLNSVSKYLSLAFAAAFAAAFAMLLLVPAAKSDTSLVSWTAPTPADHSRFSVKPGAKVSFSLSAATTVPGGVVHIARCTRCPSGAVFTTVRQQHRHRNVLVASGTGGRLHDSVRRVDGRRRRGAHVDVFDPRRRAGAKAKYPRSYSLADDKVAHWAAGTEARRSARPAEGVVPRGDDARHVDDGRHAEHRPRARAASTCSASETWYRVRLPILPNNSTGWVQARYLGDLYTVHTHLYVDRAQLHGDAEARRRVVFKTIVGVGKSVWPTPRGEFYIRDKMTSFANPVYGPIAFGTSARSAVLTDWPGGGFVGVHGTNEPRILPGRVSHGCIRMPNASILKLARLMPVGTPLTVR